MRVEAIGKPEGCKLLRIRADFRGSSRPGDDAVLESISICGDFFAMPEERFETVERRLAGTRLADLGGAFETLLEEEGIQAIGISGAGILATIRGALNGLSVQNTENRP